jgi:hypothetical protein
VDGDQVPLLSANVCSTLGLIKFCSEIGGDPGKDNLEAGNKSKRSPLHSLPAKMKKKEKRVNVPRKQKIRKSEELDQICGTKSPLLKIEKEEKDVDSKNVQKRERNEKENEKNQLKKLEVVQKSSQEAKKPEIEKSEMMKSEHFNKCHQTGDSANFVQNPKFPTAKIGEPLDADALHLNSFQQSSQSTWQPNELEQPNVHLDS